MEEWINSIPMDNALPLLAVPVALTGAYLGYRYTQYRRRSALNAADSYQGKTVLITGASSGIGKQLALDYAKRGATLILGARREERLNQVVEQCNQLGGEAHALRCDVSSEDDCKQLIDFARELDGRLDVMVLNAGRSNIVKFSDIEDYSVMHNLMDVNFFGCYYPTVYGLDLLRESGGKIVVISSLSGLIGASLRTTYAATKFALVGFYEALQCEEPLVNITIVCPGYVVSEIHNDFMDRTGSNKNLTKFVSTEEASQKIIYAEQDNLRKLVFPFSGKVMAILNAIGLVTPSMKNTIGRKIMDANFPKEGI
eukprot:TRINITY_DN5321_c0_g1_i2.p2 TRINITY_DN5321_c0_g1~~TRINITY_DN5321_c0_g1_i2.p2  ORF type:complete len:348 (-),score=70.53 TRINITY_DN5321_c0_g1_i2:1392-2327(-)